MDILKILRIIILYLLIKYIKCDPIKQLYQPCRINDQECLKKILRTVAAVGDPELEVKPSDPIVVKDIKLKYLENATFIINEATLTGQSNCIYDLVWINLKFRNGTIKFGCNLTLKGAYEANVENPALLGIPFNNTVTGNGNFNIDIDKIQLTENFNFHVIKDEEGIIRLRYESGEALYDVTNKEHDVKIDVTGYQSEDENIDTFVNKYLNENWRKLFSTLGPQFLNENLRTIVAPELLTLFNMPANKFIFDDLEAYVDRTDVKTCYITDIQCHLELIKRLKSSIPKNALTDTRSLKNTSISLPGLMDLKILEGNMKGMDSCKIRKARFDLPNKKFVLNQICDLMGKGNYTAEFHANATMSTFGGNAVKAKGNAELTMVNLPLNAEYKIEVVKKNNNTYLTMDGLETSYDIDEPGHKIVFKLDGIFLGSMDISEIAMNIMNENWYYFAPDFAPVFIYEINKRINEPLVNYITSLPAKDMFSGPINY